MTHQFDIKIATELNVNCAVIYNNLKIWCEQEKNFYDGNYWTCNSKKAWKKLFPYLGEHQIRASLKKLEDNGYIKSGYYNESNLDRTKWYCVTELNGVHNEI